MAKRNGHNLTHVLTYSHMSDVSSFPLQTSKIESVVIGTDIIFKEAEGGSNLVSLLSFK